MSYTLTFGEQANYMTPRGYSYPVAMKQDGVVIFLAGSTGEPGVSTANTIQSGSYELYGNHVNNDTVIYELTIDADLNTATISSTANEVLWVFDISAHTTPVQRGAAGYWWGVEDAPQTVTIDDTEINVNWGGVVGCDTEVTNGNVNDYTFLVQGDSLSANTSTSKIGDWTWYYGSNSNWTDISSTENAASSQIIIPSAAINHHIKVQIIYAVNSTQNTLLEFITPTVQYNLSGLIASAATDESGNYTRVDAVTYNRDRAVAASSCILCTWYIASESNSQTQWTGSLASLGDGYAWSLPYSCAQSIYTESTPSSGSIIHLWGQVGPSGGDCANGLDIEYMVDNWSCSSDPSTNPTTFQAYYRESSTPATQLTISNTIVSDKTYDGTTNATITLGTVSGINSGDNVTVTAQGSFSSSDAGNYNVVVTYSLSGTDANNYLAPANDTIAASITPIQLTVAGTVVKGKVANSDTAATVIIGTVNGIINNDDVIVSATGTFNNSAAGNNKPVTVVYALSGSNASSYTAPQTETLYANIISSSEYFLTYSTGRKTSLTNYYSTLNLYSSGDTTNPIWTGYSSGFTGTNAITADSKQWTDKTLNYASATDSTYVTRIGLYKTYLGVSLGEGTPFKNCDCFVDTSLSGVATLLYDDKVLKFDVPTTAPSVSYSEVLWTNTDTFLGGSYNYDITTRDRIASITLNNATINNNTITFSWTTSWTDSNNTTGVYDYFCVSGSEEIDAQVEKTLNSTTITLNTENIGNGTYDFHIRATGNCEYADSLWATQTVTIASPISPIPGTFNKTYDGTTDAPTVSYANFCLTSDSYQTPLTSSAGIDVTVKSTYQSSFYSSASPGTYSIPSSYFEITGTNMANYTVTSTTINDVSINKLTAGTVNWTNSVAPTTVGDTASVTLSGFPTVTGATFAGITYTWSQASSATGEFSAITGYENISLGDSTTQVTYTIAPEDSGKWIKCSFDFTNSTYYEAPAIPYVTSGEIGNATGQTIYVFTANTLTYNGADQVLVTRTLANGITQTEADEYTYTYSITGPDGASTPSSLSAVTGNSAGAYSISINQTRSGYTTKSYSSNVNITSAVLTLKETYKETLATGFSKVYDSTSFGIVSVPSAQFDGWATADNGGSSYSIEAATTDTNTAVGTYNIDVSFTVTRNS